MAWLLAQRTSDCLHASPRSPPRSLVFDHPALKVVAASKEHMLAMKTRAARATDKGDVERLLAACGYDTVEQVDALVADVFGEGLGERQRLWLESVVGGLQRTSEDMELPSHPIPPVDLMADSSLGLGPSCGKWMPVAKRHCVEPRRHSGECR